MEFSIVIPFLKELMNELDKDKVIRLLRAFLSNFYKNFLAFYIEIFNDEEEEMEFYKKNKKIIDKWIDKGEPFFKEIEKDYEPINFDARFVFFSPFTHLREVKGFIIIEFSAPLSQDEKETLTFLSFFLGPVLITRELYHRLGEMTKRFEIGYELVLFGTRVYEKERVILYTAKNIYELFPNIRGVIIYEPRGKNLLFPKVEVGKIRGEIIPIDSSFQGKAMREMAPVVEGDKITIPYPTKDWIYGIIYIEKTKGGFTRNEVKTFEMLANTLAIVIKNIEFIEEVRKSKEMLERKYQEMMEKRLEEEKMATIGKFSSSIVHELKNLLAAIINMTEFIELKIKEEKILKLLEITRKEAELMKNLLVSLLDLTKPFILDIKRYKLKEIIEETLNMSEFFVKGKEVDKKIIFECNEDIEILCDRTKFSLCFLNLFKNAIEAIDKKGILEVRVNRVEKDLEVHVCDTGKGIEEGYLKKIFSPFFTTKEKGAGLGLSFVKKIIDTHRFFITVSSKINKGTCFKIVIPGEYVIEGSNP